MRKSIKFSMIFVLAVTLLFSLFAAVMVNYSHANATESVFEMEYGASVKLSQNGLRFMAKMDKDHYDLIMDNDNVKLCGYVAPVEEFDKVAEYKDLGRKVGGELDKGKIYEKDGYYHVKLVITNLDQYELCGTTFSAIIFIEDSRTGVPEYTYADLAKGVSGVSDIANQTRTQHQVLNAAIMDEGVEDENVAIMATYGEWYGSEAYPIEIKDTDDYDTFIGKLSDSAFNTAINGKYVHVREGVEDGYSSGNKISDKVSVNKDTGHIVTFYDGNRIVKREYVADGNNASLPEAPTRDGYEFVSWVGSYSNITEDTSIYARWKTSKGSVKDIGDLTVYGVIRSDGTTISTDSDVIGEKVVLLSGDLGDGVYFPGDNKPTDNTNTADQAYIAFDGNYSFNDFFVADFTGKNMPIMAFFANNYNNSVFYGNGNKNGVVVATGLTWPNGLLFTQTDPGNVNNWQPSRTTIYNGNGLCMFGPHMIYSVTDQGNGTTGVLLNQTTNNVALGRNNLVNNKHYRIIMGFQVGNENSNRAIKLVYMLYDLDNNVIVESFSQDTYNFFADDWANNGQTRNQFCVGSIVAYGYFGTTTVLDKVYDIYEDSSIGAIAADLGMKIAVNNVTFDGDSVILGSGAIGSGAGYATGDTGVANGILHQSYYAINGEYGLGDYVAFDFTGKNMPAVAFFAENYNDSMYYGSGGKKGVVLLTGLTQYDGTLYTGTSDRANQYNGKGLILAGPHMIKQMNGDAVDSCLGFSETKSKSNENVALGRANLDGNTKYRVIIGTTTGTAYSNGIRIEYSLYNITGDTPVLVESYYAETWNYFTDSYATGEGYSSRTEFLTGSIVLYGYFGTTCTIDKVWGVFEDTTIAAVAKGLFGYNITFKNYDGTVLYSTTAIYGEIPEYSGAVPSRAPDAVCSSYTFTGWDTDVVAATDDAVYTATFSYVERTSGITKNNLTTISGSGVVLGYQSLGTTWNYVGPNDNDDIHQSYLALDGNYGLNDYIVLDFTGKNMPEIAFFAKNYNDSMYYQYGGKQGVVVVSGITFWNGTVNPNVLNGSTYVNFESALMIQNANEYGFTSGSQTSRNLARANLVDNTHYRVIMGFTAKGTSAIRLQWYLYNLDTSSVVEEVNEIYSWNFFTGTNSDTKVQNKSLDDLVGSIVLYGKFGTNCTIDKVWGVFEDTTISAVAAGFGNTYTVEFVDYDGTVLQSTDYAFGSVPAYTGITPTRGGDAVYESYEFTGWDKKITAIEGDIVYTATYTGTKRDDITLNNVSVSGSGVVLASSSIGDGATLTTGAEGTTGYVHQSYLALDGNYGLDDYIMLDFTGKNMPEIAFFAKNYNDSMYYVTDDSKKGVVVASGVTNWNGTETVSGIDYTRTYVMGARMARFAGGSNGLSGTISDAISDSKIARANLVAGTHYRVIMGFTKYSDTTITLNYAIYNIDNGTMVEIETRSQSGYPVFNNWFPEKAGELSGSIVLYGKFGTTCTIDKVWGVFEDTNISAITSELGKEYTVEFQNYDGAVLQNSTYDFGDFPVYAGNTPVKAEDGLYTYTFAGWDKAIGAVNGDVTYVAMFEAESKGSGITSHNVTANNDGSFVLANGSIGNNAHYSGSNNLQDPQVVGTVDQAYLAFESEDGYGFNDYIAFDFTGKNMPSVAFFANDYDESMYYGNGNKSGLVVLTGLTTWQGVLYTENTDSKDIYAGKGLILCGPLMVHNTLNSGKNGVLGFQVTSKNNSDVALGRANLVDGKQYRVIMGIEAGDDLSNYSIKLVYVLYNITDNVIVEEFSAETYNFFIDGFAKDGQTRNQYCLGSIVLYGHFGTTTTLDRVWGVYENTTLNAVKDEIIGDISASSAPDYSRYQDTFDFYAYSAYSDGTYVLDGETYYIGKTLASVKQYSLYGEVGMNIFFPSRSMLINGDPETVTRAKKLIDDLKKAGITKTILCDSRIVYLSLTEGAIVGAGKAYASEAALDEYIYNCIKDYADYPGVYGLQLGDEPKYVCLPAYAAVYKSIKRVCAEHGYNLFIQYNLNPLNYAETVYTNYYPASSGTYAWSNYRYVWNESSRFTACVTRYKQYIKDFLDAMDPDSITYDDYPLMTNSSGVNYISQTYIPCLQIVAKEASNRGIKFYNVTQAYQNTSNYGSVVRRYVTENGANWLNNILLGFGVKGIAYYTYYTRQENSATGGESYKDGSSFVDYNGNTTELYDVMKGIMADDQIFASTILQFKYLGSRYYKGSTAASSNTHVAKITTSNSFSKLSSFSVNKEHALVTELYDATRGNYMYMAMNIVDPDASGSYTETMTLTFNNYTKALVYRNGTFTEEDLTNHVLTITADPGEAAFVIPFN